MKRMLSTIAAVAAAVATLQAAQVVLPNGTTIEGTDIRARPDGSVVLTTPQGQREFAKGQYTRAVADKPAEYDQASQLAAQKKYDDAIKLLNDVVTRFRYLEWDNYARAAIAQMQVAKGDPSAAAATYEEMFRASPATKSESKVLWGYLDALRQAGKYDKLAPQLDELIGKGSRADAAKAYTIRGDMKASQEQVEGALLDYLRTVVLFQAERDAQPEALFKAGELLEKLRDPRAKDMYAKLVQNYPQSEFAQKARAKGK